MAFAIGDCGLPLDTGAAFRAVKSVESEELWRALTERNPPETIAPIAAAFRKEKRGSGPEFDVVSCQFAVHYFFQSAQTLDDFLRNVAGHLREGGYFLATFMDGELVHQALAAEVRGRRRGTLLGRVANTVIWAIQKDYEVFDTSSEDVYGKEIGVYLENTRQTITEYLVPFSVMVAKAAGVGLNLVESETFGATFEKESRAHGDKKDPMYHIFAKLRRETVQRRFSGFNRWAVFRKAAQE